MNSLYKKIFILGFTLLTIVSCKPKQKKQIKYSGFKQIKLEYAEKFKIEKKQDTTLLTINASKKEDIITEKYTLVQKKSPNSSTNTIQVPCKRIICLSSTQLAYLIELDELKDIVAINSSRYLQNKKIKALLASGKIKHIGKEGNFQLETIIALNPDVIFVSPFKVGGFDVLRNMNIPLVPLAAYNEKTPLGRAEWVKMMALFLGNSNKADSIFEGTRTRYNKLKALCKNVKKRPSIFSGKMRSGSWYVPGGNSFYAHYFRDAGAEYVIKDTIEGAYPLDFETIYQKAANCDFWRIVNPEKIGITLQELLSQDARYKDFKAFNNNNIMFCNIREKPYYELAAVKPDILLSDYIYFFHPELLPKYKPVFYTRMNKN